MQKCATIWLQMKLTITEYSVTTSAQLDYTIWEERTLHLVLRLRGETEHDTNDNVTTKTQNTFNTAHMNTDTWCAQFSCLLVRFLSSWFRALHRMAQGCVAHVISSTHEVCGSPSTLRPPFSSTSSSSHSSSNSCTSSCTSFTTLRGSSSTVYSAWKGMDSFCDSYLLTGNEPNAYDLMETFVESYTESLTPSTVLQARVTRGCGVRRHRTRGYASWSSPSTWPSLSTRTLVCRWVVVCVRANGAIRWRANRTTCWTNWSRR